MRNLWRRFRAWPTWAQVPIGLAAGFFVLALVTSPLLPDEEQGLETVSSAPTVVASVTSTTAAPSTSTTVPALPAGDDTAITRVTDGDSLVVTDGTRIRLIGIDTPEVESDDCFSAEATDHLRQLVPVGTKVRLVYDVGRLDVYDRTLAYVYRLSDGLLVNVAQARDGFAQQLTVPPNVRHADEIGDAVAEARTAKRGLWQACSSTTTVAPLAAAARAVAPTTDLAPAPADPIPFVGDPPPADEPGSGCHPSYAGACVPIASDVDCGGGSGNGPAYVYETDIQVIGDDVYGLDGPNQNGIGCES